MRNNIYSAILFFAFVGVLMAWPGKGESFRSGVAEDQLRNIFEEQPLALRGFINTPAGATTSLHVSNLPNGGPWRVTVGGAVDNGESIMIKQGDSSGTPVAYLTKNSINVVDAAAVGVINGREFYIDVPSGAVRFNVSWEYFPETEVTSSRTEF